MAVLISTRIKGQTTEGYDGVLSAVGESIQKAPGFLLHVAHPAEGEWMVYEIWETKEQADRWFAQNIVPNLPPGIHPKRSYQILHSVVRPVADKLSA